MDRSLFGWPVSWRARTRRVILRMCRRAVRESWPVLPIAALDLGWLARWGPRTAAYIWHRKRRNHI